MAAKLVDRLAILVAVRRFPGMGAADSRSLVPCALTVMSVCSILFVDLLLFRFGVFWGMCDENSCNTTHLPVLYNGHFNIVPDHRKSIVDICGHIPHMYRTTTLPRPPPESPRTAARFRNQCGRWGFFSGRDTPTYNDRTNRVSIPRPSAY
jgi:hypothetical protein